MTTETFSSQAEIVLRSRAHTVLDEFLSQTPQGKWHPNGFAVFHFGAIKGLGHMRFHVWPRSIRVALEGQPAIHSHPWDLCSLVIAGCYKDTVYRTKEFLTEGPDRLQGFKIEFGSSEKGDKVFPIPVWYELTVDEERTVREGSFHRIEAGALHMSRIEVDTFVATLLITGEKVDFDKLLLIGDGKFGERSYLRPPVSADAIDHIKSDLLKTHRFQK